MRLFAAILLPVLLFGCKAADKDGSEALLPVLSAPLVLEGQKDELIFRYEYRGNSALCTYVTDGMEFTTEYKDGAVVTRVFGTETTHSSLPESCPVIEITDTLMNYRRQCLAKDPAFTCSSGIYYLGGATLVLEDGKLFSLTTPGGIILRPAA